MKKLFAILAVLALVQCNKEVSYSAGDTPVSIHSTRDSLIGNWKYICDYRFTSTVANPSVLFDSTFSGNYTPFSYYQLNNDSTYKWYRTAMQATPTTGYGHSGYWKYDSTTRTIRLTILKETLDDFVSVTTLPSPQYFTARIKTLGANQLVTLFKVPSQANPATEYWWWHDRYQK